MAAALILLILEAVLQFSHHKISKLQPGLAAPQEGAKSQLRELAILEQQPLSPCNRIFKENLSLFAFVSLVKGPSSTGLLIRHSSACVVQFQLCTYLIYRLFQS